jgi:hypothetical protein
MNSEILPVQNPSVERVRFGWYKVILIKGDYILRKQIISEIQNLIIEKQLWEYISSMYIEQTRGLNIDKSYVAIAKKIKMKFFSLGEQSQILPLGHCYIFFLVKSEILDQLPQEVMDGLIKVLCNRHHLNVIVTDTNLKYYKELLTFLKEKHEYHIEKYYEELLTFQEPDKYYGELLACYKKEHEYPTHKLDTHSFRITIPYEPVVSSNDRNPFNLLAETSTVTVNSLPPENYDLFLYWISSLGSGSWESFMSACNMLQIPHPKRLLRRLKLLGHIETSADGKRWAGTPISLVSVKALHPTSQEFILCGQRSSKLVEILGNSKSAPIECLEQPHGNAPLCIRVQLDSNPEAIDGLIKVLRDRNIPIQNVGNASLRFAEALPNWQEWMQTLPRISAPILGYDFEYYDIKQGRFIKYNFPDLTGMYQLKHQKLLQLMPHVCFFDKASDRWFQGDWYGLRFLALQYRDQRLMAKYDRETNNLYIPWSQRWSEIYERALVLSSGCLPRELKTNYFGRTLHYQNVQAEVAELLASKLNINLN